MRIDEVEKGAAMGLASMKAFLRPNRPDASDLLRFLQMSLQGHCEHVLEGDSDELAMYRAEMASTAQRVSENASAEDVLWAVTVSLRSLEDYNRRTKKFILAQASEMKAALRTTTDTIAALLQSQTESTTQLTVVERKMEQASAIEDIRALRRQLQDCLTMIRHEGKRLRTESVERLESLQKQAEAALKAGEAAFPLAAIIDAVTGLENRAIAEKNIRDKIAKRTPCVVALFVVNRLATINRRFGRTVGDEVLLQVAQHLAQLMPPESTLFRWSGPALVAVVEIHSNYDDLNNKLTRIAAGQLEKNIDKGERTVFVPIATVLSLQKVSLVSMPNEVFRRMDQFVADNEGDQQPVE